MEVIRTKILRLQEHAESMRGKKTSAMLDRIVALMKESGVSVADIEAHVGGKKRVARVSKKTAGGITAVAAKYMDSKTGATWSGRGRAPAWIANARNRDPESGATWSGRGPAPAGMANAKDPSKFAKAAIAGDVKVTSRNATKKASASRGRKGPPKGKRPAKYLNPETGATWSGRGPAPAWLAAASDHSQFLISRCGAEIVAS